MVAKRYLCLILTLWLINAVICFHGASSFANVTDHLQYPGETCQEGDTALAYVTQVFSSEENGGDANHNPTKRFPRKILVRRVADFNIVLLPVLLDFGQSDFAIDLHCTFGKSWFNKAFLPGYYNFLFRFKPF